MQRSHPVLSLLLTLALLGSLLLTLGLSGVYLYLSPQLPSVEKLLDAKMQIPLRIYAEDGALIGEFGEKFRTPITRENIPEALINAVLAAEDDRFLKHRGIDIAGLLRAAGELVRSGEIRSGGSTITMQVARNFFLTKERSFARKFNEILLSLKIERLLSKDQILELYLNKIYLGKRAYGVQAASAVYYGKDIRELTLAQIATIAGLPKAPSANNPINNPQRALTRRNWILGRMKQLAFISEDEWQAAVDEPPSASNFGPKLQLDAQYAAEMARAFAVARLGTSVYTDGIKVTTTINSRYQAAATHAIQGGLDAYANRHGYRGPEQSLGTLEIDEQRKQLRRLRTINQRIPALITSITETTVSGDNETQNASYSLGYELADGSVGELAWRGIRRYLSEDRRSPRIDNPNEILRTGDIIRLQVAADSPNDRNLDSSSTEPPIKKQLTLSQIPQASASLISLSPTDGAIKAVMGGYDFNQSKFNRAAQAYRQPGYNFKPFIYAAAFENNFHAASVINDAPIVFSDDKLETDWRPENASGKFYGPTTLRRALYLSRNLVSVRLLREMGIGTAINYLKQFDLSAGKLPRDLSLALGSYAMTPLEVAGMYAVLANGGFKIDPYIVDRIETLDGQLLYEATPAIACADCEPVENAFENPHSNSHGTVPDNGEFEEADSLLDIINSEEKTNVENDTPPAIYAPRIMDARVAFIIDDILQDTIQRGTATRAKSLGRTDLAGKTGTTNGRTDAWFSGYHPELVTTTWLGFDDNQKLGRNEYGGSAALPIWMDYMKQVLPRLPKAQREPPAGLVAVKIDRLTGGQPTASTRETLFENFRDDLAPQPGEQTTRGVKQQESESALDEELF